MTSNITSKVETSFPTSLSELTFTLSDPDANNTSNQTIYRILQDLRRSTLSIHNRLISITKDADFVRTLSTSDYPDFPIVANERCGSWYISPSVKAGSAYFKSTDGHVGQWSFSLRRLNLNVLQLLGRHRGLVLVDSTRRGKSLPDALRRTVPIWVAVWNRVLFGPGIRPGTEGRRFFEGKFQSRGLEQSEVRQIELRMEGWVKGLTELGLDIDEVREQVRRPIRCVWVINGEGRLLPDGWIDEDMDTHRQQWNSLVLCSASRRVVGAEMSEDGYVQGAGDDSEGWSKGLTAKLFWEHKESLLSKSEDQLSTFINNLTNNEGNSQQRMQTELILPTNNLYLAAGDLTQAQAMHSLYGFIVVCDGHLTTDSKNILNLSCRKGKLGSKDLRTKLLVARDEILSVLQQKRNASILFICETGKDLSVGVVVMVLCLFYTADGILNLDLKNQPIDKTMIKQRLAWITMCKPDANPSRSTLQAVNSFLIGKPQ